jgi:Tol biopolymer transport system component
MVTSYSAMTFGADFRPRHTFQVSGIPSRTRVSPDGRYAAYTVFLTGHSYAVGNFTTRTVLIDMANDREITDLEQFEVWRDGKITHAPDFNFWGVTFAKDSKRFYATLATSGTPYLVEGNIASRTARVLYKHVECPSLSPDNTHIAFKRWTDRGWRLHVLDLTTMTDTPLIAESRSVDDQVEWLDDRHILYTPMVDAPTGENVWMLATDGSEPPRLFLPQAYSPVVIHERGR